MIRGTINDAPLYTIAEVNWKITLLAIEPAVQDNMIFIIGDTLAITDAIEVFSYSPATAGPYTIAYSVAITGNPISSLTVNSGPSEISVGLESSGTANVHTVTLTGTLSHSSAITATDDFTLTIVTLAGTLPDQTYRIETAGLAKTVSYSEATSSLGTYTFTDSVVNYDTGTGVESTAPTWLSVNDATNLLTIQTASTADAGSYDLAVKANVVERTSASHYISWNAKVFAYTTQVNDFQIYVIGDAD